MSYPGEYRQKVFKAKQVHIKGEQRTWIEECDSFVVGKDQSIEIQGARSTSVGGDDITVVSSNSKLDVTATTHIKAADVKIEATGTIELSAGGSSVVICSAGVYITGAMVYINSGSGPTVGPVEGGIGRAPPKTPRGGKHQAGQGHAIQQSRARSRRRSRRCPRCRGTISSRSSHR